MFPKVGQLISACGYLFLVTQEEEINDSVEAVPDEPVNPANKEKVRYNFDSVCDLQPGTP